MPQDTPLSDFLKVSDQDAPPVGNQPCCEWVHEGIPCKSAARNRTGWWWLLCHSHSHILEQEGCDSFPLSEGDLRGITRQYEQEEQLLHSIES